MYSSGQPLTTPVSKYYYEGSWISEYGERNNYRVVGYHRADLGVTLKNKEKPGKRLKSNWNFSVYNAYARKNAWVINFVADENDVNKTNAEMTYLFSIIPSITYNFNF